MKEYKGIIKNFLFENYQETLVIDIYNDKIEKYLIKDTELYLDKESSYQEYLNNLSNIIASEDLDNYINSLSISNLEKSSYTIKYKMKNETNEYKEYINNLKLVDDNQKKIIIVLVSKPINNINNEDNFISSNTSIETKYNKLTDSISLAMFKIHNIINSNSKFSEKEDYIKSILSGLVNEYPHLNNEINNNAINYIDNSKETIMIIDDDKMTCSLIKKIFDKDYNIKTYNNGKEAIDALIEIDSNYSSKNKISCIFLDLLMPILDGFSVLDYLNDHNYLNKLPVIIISGNYDKETRKRVYSYQIADMLEKPFNVQVVRHRIENLINLYRSSNSINNIMLEQHQELKNIILSLIHSYEIDQSRMMNLIEKYTKILTLQVSSLYKEYNINSSMIDKIAASSKYFSIGNYTLPKTILYKKGVYKEEERSLIKMANINGANIVKYVLSKENTSIDPKYCYEITKYYNERYDGNGYPEGLSGNSIPLSTQIASIAIEYANLINTIVPIDYEKVASLIIMESGRKFNPKIIECFKKVKEEFEEITKVGG